MHWAGLYVTITTRPRQTFCRWRFIIMGFLDSFRILVRISSRCRTGNSLALNRRYAIIGANDGSGYDAYRHHLHWMSKHALNMMTSSNGNIFRVTGHLCGEFPTQMPVTRSFDVFFHLRLNKRLSKQPRGWWFETLSLSLWRRRNEHLGKVTASKSTAFKIVCTSLQCFLWDLRLLWPLLLTCINFNPSMDK